jgi:hypothetical protein
MYVYFSSGFVFSCVGSDFFLNSHIAGVESTRVHSARRPFAGLLYLPRMIMMIMENFVE